MTRFSNPASDAAAAAQAYTRTMLDVIGDRDPLAVMDELVPWLEARTGVHSERGPESIGHTIRMLGAHDLVHRRQIDRILASV